MPVLTEFGPDLWGATVGFELPGVIGSISMRADGQCDVDVLSVTTDEATFTYTILATEEEVTEHLVDTYRNIKREQVIDANLPLATQPPDNATH